ncbi:HD domain-containing protein [Paractinoplanes lichenicola]|uniref:HD domain-containing protein n=1 Tax=Paractinoplanes lichenicola TaxID=2802976 RepID=A0ABS1VTW7_9ACTN|nr:HD domain-containing protein [Actinoplanes lichenicola]MBL7257927.1 HD domain-containing protein [Actinoplanes lichenicola]
MLPLPPEATALLDDLEAPPRLTAHLLLVHDVAASILDWLSSEYPGLPVDKSAVLFGAATHDIGKTVHVEELSAPGTRHEPAGHELLLSRGVPERLARFAGTHGSWPAEGVELEDLLVSLADKVWKAKRVDDLERLIVGRLAAFSGREPWEVFLALDDRLTALGDKADERLAFQNNHPIRR